MSYYKTLTSRVLLLATLLVALSVGVSTSTASAMSGSCGAGRCTVWFSKAETRSLAQGRIPAPPAAVSGPLRAAYYAAAYGHRWFASQYASWNWCSGFRLSVYPWEGQGYFGYRC